MFPRFRRIVLKLRKGNLKPTLTLAALCIFTFAVFLYLLYFQTKNRKISSSGRSLVIGLRDLPRVKGTPMSHFPLNLLYLSMANSTNTSTDQSIFNEYGLGYQIYTSGCQIPLIHLNFKQYEETKIKHLTQETCGKRAVFLRKSLKGVNNVTITIYKYMFKMSESAQTYSCCYRYIRSYYKGNKYKTQYTPCIKIQNNDMITLKSDFINVKCVEINKNNESTIIYQDFYAFARKLDIEERIQSKQKENYNVLMLGIDSMSIAHFVQSMRRTFDFLKQNFWLAYPGLHKIADNKLQNLIATLTGSTFTSFNKTCFGKMDSCNDRFIWSQFKEAGYITAYGEDYLRLGETFSGTFRFHEHPTDHFLKPLFQNHEREIYDKGLVCTGQVTSGQQILDYALDFANTYRNDNFFGLFWMNSFSSNINSVASRADKILENFLNSLTYTGVLKNTFIILFSSHGVQFGELRLQVAGYYEERLPLLYMWYPRQFQTLYIKELRHAALNQMSLVTLYDLYNTLVGIRRLSFNMTAPVDSNACKNCVSLFQPIQWTRTCADAAIGQKLCSCHTLYPLDIQDTEGIKSVFFAAAHINSIAHSVQTKNCWKCARLTLSKVVRIHFYYVNTILFYVVAFSMAPANMTYEVKMSKTEKKLNMIGEVSYISPYWGNGSCTLKQSDRLYCACQLLDECLNSSL